MRYLTGAGTGLWVAPVIAAVFVAYTWIVSRVASRGTGGEAVEVAPRTARKAA